MKEGVLARAQLARAVDEKCALVVTVLAEMVALVDF